MTQLVTSVNSKCILAPTSDKILGFPSLGDYGIQAIHRGAKWIGVSSSAEDKKIFDFVLIKLGFLNPTAVTSIDDPLQTRIAKSTINFSRLFEEGTSLMKKIGLLQKIEPSSDLSFDITSPKDLLEANLALRDLAEKAIFKSLFPSQTNELTEAQRLRITQTKFLGPLTLSQMLKGNISTEQALLLITCLGLQKNKHKIRVCDPATGNFHKDFQANMLTSKPCYKLIFLDPNELLKSLPKATYDVDQDSEDTYILFEGTKMIVKVILGELDGHFSSLSKPSQLKLVNDLMHASVDHEKVQLIIDQLETYFPDEHKDAVLKCKALIAQETKGAFKKCRELVQKLPTPQKFDDALKNIEARARLTKASQQKDFLEKNFNLYKEDILNYLKLLSQEYKIDNSVPFTLTWIVQGTKITETMEITKTCAIARRVLCPKTSANNRSDLVYFSADANEESVVSRWKSLCQEHSLSDCQLAEQLLLLYQGKTISVKLVPFLSFLMILLLGKEPAYDSASFAANFILLFSIKLGVHSFEEALSRMPMIPQGAIAAKQFLLHVSGKPLDALSRVQYKDKKQVPESTFLPTSASFLGSANDWIQVYDNVATTALECCRRLFFKDIDPENPHLLQLQTDLKLLLDKDELAVWDMPLLLRLFSERKFLINHGKDSDAIDIIDQKNKCAARFLRAMGETVHAKSNSSEQCARFLTRGVDLSNPKIKELQQIIDKQDSENWQTWMLSQQEERTGSVLEAMEKTIRGWDPSAVCRTLNIDPYDDSDETISKMDKEWDRHFLSYMSPYQSEKNFAELRAFTFNHYRLPVSYYDLASAMDPENGLNDEDPLAKWAISYILDRHPLNRV